MLQSLGQFIGRTLLKRLGWSPQYDYAPPKKCIIIVPHHTSNWDFIIGILYEMAIHRYYRYIAKDSLFKSPIGFIFRLTKGIPADRSGNKGLVQSIAEQSKHYDDFALCIAPSGTRKKTKTLKSGFYHMAIAAKLPICMSYIDWKNKEVGIGPSFMPSGNKNEDIKIIQEFYRNKGGKYPDNQTPLTFSSFNS